MAKRHVYITPEYEEVVERLGSITFEFTTCHDVLDQYFQLREACYKEEFSLEDTSFLDHKDNFDYTSHVLIVRDGNKCIAGVRLTVHHAFSQTILPLEEGTVRLKQLLPFYDLKPYNYCECSRFVIDPNYRKPEILAKMFQILDKKAADLDCRYEFQVTDLRFARVLRSFFSKTPRHFEVLTNVEVPHKAIYGTHKKHLSVVHNPLVNKKSFYNQGTSNSPIEFRDFFFDNANDDTDHFHMAGTSEPEFAFI